MTLYFDQIQVGDKMPPLTSAPITEVQLVRYAGASGDFNPIHTVHHVAVEAGLGGVIAHGMLVMGIVGRAITDWVDVTALRKFGARFVGMTRPGQTITVTGLVVEKMVVNGEPRLRCEVKAADQHGEVKVKGYFIAAVPTRSER